MPQAASLAVTATVVLWPTESDCAHSKCFVAHYLTGTKPPIYLWDTGLACTCITQHSYAHCTPLSPRMRDSTSSNTLMVLHSVSHAHTHAHQHSTCSHTRSHTCSGQHQSDLQAPPLPLCMNFMLLAKVGYSSSYPATLSQKALARAGRAKPHSDKTWAVEPWHHRVLCPAMQASRSSLKGTAPTPACLLPPGHHDDSQSLLAVKAAWQQQPPC